MGRERPQGYYWVLFNWPACSPQPGFPSRGPNWEPASWDEKTKTFMLIGSKQEIPDDRRILLKIGPKIEPPD